MYFSPTSLVVRAPSATIVISCGPHLFDRDSRCPRKADVASLVRDCGTPNRSAAVDRSDCADRFRLPAAAGDGRPDLGSAASNSSLQTAGNQASANCPGNTNLSCIPLT